MSSTVSEPLLNSMSPNSMPVAPGGTCCVVQEARAQLSGLAGNGGRFSGGDVLSIQNGNGLVKVLPRRFVENLTGAVDLYQALSVYWWPGSTVGVQYPMSSHLFRMLAPST